MKITTVLKQNFSVQSLLMFTLCFITLFGHIASECNAKYGCLARNKFMSYVTVQGKDGDAFPLRTILNYKVIYVFTDRVVFYTSSDTSSAALEGEENEKTEKIESRVERAINFGEILLDCGKFHNKLCHAQEYPSIASNESFKIVQKSIQNNADVFCLILPFFENGYKKSHEKMAYICVTDSKELYKIITFKNYLSRRIENYQLKISSDRFNGFNGLLKRKGKFIVVADNKMMNVIGSIFNGHISFSTNNEDMTFVKSYSFYQQREHKNGAYIVSEGLVKKKVPEDWSTGLSPIPSPECCIYFKGETENIVLCLTNDAGTSVETASDICRNKMKPVYGEVLSSLRGIKFSEAYHELSHNKIKRNDCKSSEYNTMKWRAEKTINYAVGVDCSYVINYINGDEYSQKFNFCFKNYGDELKLELKLMSLDDDEIYDSINNCVYKSEAFSKYFSEAKFKELMNKAKLLKKETSFLEMESDTGSGSLEGEKDDIEDDDEDVISASASVSSKKESNLRSDDINFTETGSKTDKAEKINKRKTIKDYTYSQPKDSYETADVNRMKIFRNTQMTDLQKKHTWTPSPRETVSETFNLHAASLGKKNSDQFVSFLGFIRDASYRASAIVAKNEEQKLLDK